MQPLHPDLKYIPLYIFPKNNGFANNKILCIADQIKVILQDLDIIVTTIATDGDTGYNSKAKETFSKYISVFLQKGFLKAVEHIQNSNDEVFWISDSRCNPLLDCHESILVQCQGKVQWLDQVQPFLRKVSLPYNSYYCHQLDRRAHALVNYCGELPLVLLCACLNGSLW